MVRRVLPARQTARAIRTAGEIRNGFLTPDGMRDDQFLCKKGNLLLGKRRGRAVAKVSDYGMSDM